MRCAAAAVLRHRLRLSIRFGPAAQLPPDHGEWWCGQVMHLLTAGAQLCVFFGGAEDHAWWQGRTCPA
jgi:hypothetical protein